MLGSGEAKEDNSAQIPHYGADRCALLLSKVTEELMHELQDHTDAVFPDVCYLFCVYQTQSVNSPIILYLEKRGRKKLCMLLRRIF